MKSPHFSLPAFTKVLRNEVYYLMFEHAILMELNC